MANIIDALLITLGLDNTGFKKGQKETEDGLNKLSDADRKRAKEAEATAKVMATGFNRVKNELIGLVAIAAGASTLKGFLTNMVNGQAALGRIATDLGMSAKELDAWSKAATTVGGTADGVKTSFQNMQAGFEAFKLGEQSPVVTAFRALGVDMADADGNLRPMKDMMLDLSAAMAKLSRQDQIKAAQMLGWDDGTLNLVRRGRDELEATVAEFYKASRATEEGVKQAQEAQAQWALFKAELQGVGQEIFNNLGPAFKAMNDALLQFSGWVSGNREGIGDFFTGLVTVMTALGRAVGWAFDKISQLSEKLSGSWIGNKIGEWTTRLMAFGGSKEAAETLRRNGIDPHAPGGSPAAASTQSSTPGGLFGGLESKFGLPEGMLEKVWTIESNRGKNMRSAAGATGHFQLMPATAASYGLSEADTMDLGKSAGAAAQMLGRLLKKYGGNSQMALSAYNWGEGNLDRYGLGAAPAETVNYWKRFSSATAGTAGRGGTTVETKIDTMNVYTQAKDANGIAASMQAAIQQKTKMAYGSTGMQ